MLKKIFIRVYDTQISNSNTRYKKVRYEIVKSDKCRNLE